MWILSVHLERGSGDHRRNLCIWELCSTQSMHLRVDLGSGCQAVLSRGNLVTPGTVYSRDLISRGDLVTSFPVCAFKS